MVHALFHPHGPGTLTASRGLINRVGTPALEKAGDPQGGSAERAPPRVQVVRIGAWAVGGLAAYRATPRLGAPSPAVSGGSVRGAAENVDQRGQNLLCWGTSWGLQCLGRGTGDSLPKAG